MAKLRIREMVETEQPLYRLEKYGASSLSDSELLAIVLGTKTLEDAQRLLVRAGGLIGLLNTPVEEICEIPWVGRGAALGLKAALELAGRLSSAQNSRPVVRNVEDVASLLTDMQYLEQEEMRVVLLDAQFAVIDIVTVYKGTVNSVHVRTAEVFRDAIRRQAVSIIIAHNHPSGDPTPSPEDIILTRAVDEGGKLLDIEMVDHLIIGQGHERWLSLKRAGII